MNKKRLTISEKLGGINLGAQKADFKKLFQKKDGTTVLDNALLVEISLIDPNPEQPRKHFNNDSLQELADSIKERGVLQPIRIRPKDGRYQIIAGERRWHAAQIAGVTHMPCIVAEQDDRTTYIDALMENIQREDLNPIDRANAISELKKHLNLSSWDEVAEKLGLSKRHIHNLLGLKTLPEEIQSDIRNGSLSEKHGRALKTIMADPGLFEQVCCKIKSDNMSGNETLLFVKSLKNPQKVKCFNALKTATEQYYDLLILTDFNGFDSGQKRFLIKSLLKMQSAINHTIDKIKVKRAEK